MNAIADKARAAAMQFEAKKDALGQVQSGDWKLRFTVSPEDVPNGLLTAPMGTRYQVVIVEIGDDEQPVVQKPENKHRLSQQAAMCCNDGSFATFLMEQFGKFWRSSSLSMEGEPIPTICARVVRNICDIQSRADLDTDPSAAADWRDLHAQYEAWKIT